MAKIIKFDIPSLRELCYKSDGYKQENKMGRYRDIMDEWFDRVWGQNDLDCIDELTDIDVATTGHMGHALKGPEDFKGFHALFKELLDDISIKILHSLEDDEWASVIYKVTARNKGTQDIVEVTGSSMIRFKNNKIIEAYEHFDFMTFFELTGRLPAQSLNSLLTDKSVSYS